MTDPGPFAPPSGALPPRTADSGPAPAPGPALPPPTGTPIATTPPAAVVVPPPPPSRPWLIPVIVAGSLVVLALLAGAVFASVTLADAVAQGPFGALGDDDVEDEFGQMDSPLRGDPGTPIAADPLTCGACFNVAHAQMITFPSGSYAALGVPITDGFTYETTVGADQVEKTGWWVSDGGMPDACYFTVTQSPLYVAPGASDGADANDDDVYYPDWHSDGEDYYLLTESFRVFDDTAQATAHLGDVEAAVGGCSSVSYPDQGWSATVAAAPALELPSSVAAYGWSEGNAYGRYYAVELQRGNLVARLVLSTDAYGATESEFRAFAEEYAAALAALEPQS